MTADPDEEALAWAGYTDPSHVDAKEPPPRIEFVEPAAKPSTPSVLLITYGILGGIYLMYSVGWIITVQRLDAARPASTEVLNAIMFQLGEFLAIAGPAIWFAAAFLLTRGRKPLLRLVLLLVGLIAVLPWPFVLGAWAR